MSLGLRGARPDLQFKATKRRREEKSFSDEERAKQQVLGYAIPNKDFLPTDLWTTKNLPSSSLDFHFTKYRPLNGSSYIARQENRLRRSFKRIVKKDNMHTLFRTHE